MIEELKIVNFQYVENNGYKYVGII